MSFFSLIILVSKLGFPFQLQAIQTGWVHPNVNLENPDEGMVCFYSTVSYKIQSAKLFIILTINFYAFSQSARTM